MPNTKQQIVFNDFRGGLNVDVASDHLAANELATAINVDYSERGSIRKRHGVIKFNVNPYHEDVTQIFEWNRANGETLLFAVIGKKLCELDSAGNRTTIANLASDRISYFFLQDVLYFIDGDKYRCYDGIQVKEIVVNDISFIVKPGEGDIPPGRYGCFVTYVSVSGKESVASKVQEVIVTEENSAIFVENIPQPLNDTAVRRYYRYNIGDGGSILPTSNSNTGLVVRVITDPTVTMLTDMNSLASKGGESYRLPDIGSLPFVMPPTPKAKFLVRHTKSNRIFMAGNITDKSALYYSEPNNPSIIKSTSRMYPTTDDGEITGLATFVDAVVVFFKRSIWVWRGIDPEIDAIWQKVPVGDGTISSNTITQITQVLTYLSSGGILGISPAAIGMNADIKLGNSYVIDFTANKVSSIIKTATNFEKSVAAYDPRAKKYLLAYCDNSTGINNKILVFDETLGAFSVWEGISANDIFCRTNGDVLIASKNYILKFDESSYSDIDVTTGEAVPIKFEAEIRSSFNAPLIRKMFTKVWTQIGGVGEEELQQYHIEVRVDNDVVVTKTINVEPSNDQYVVINERFRAVGKQLSVKVIHDEIDKGFSLYGIGVDVTPVKSYGQKV